MAFDLRIGPGLGIAHERNHIVDAVTQMPRGLYPRPHIDVQLLAITRHLGHSVQIEKGIMERRGTFQLSVLLAFSGYVRPNPKTGETLRRPDRRLGVAGE